MNLKLLIIFFIVNIVYQTVEAQSGIIKGRIFNEINNDPLVFVSVGVQGTTLTAQTDDKGQYVITGVNPGFQRLVVTSVGFETKITEEFMVSIADINFINIALKEYVAKLNEVVVESSPFQRKDESPVSLRSLGISEIERNPGGNRDISKVIQSLPGVNYTPAYRNDIIVRGGGSSENRFYLDGVEIPNINHFATQGASGGPVGIINVDFIKKVDLYSGAFPANRGNALSSILEFSQIDGHEDKFDVKTAIGASDFALTLNGPLGKKTTMIFSVRRSYLQFLFNALKLPFLPTYNDLQFKVKIKFNKKNELTFLGLGAIDQNKLNTGLKNPTEDQQYILDYLPVNKQWSYTIGAVYKHFRPKGFDLLVLSKNFFNNRSYKYLNNDNSNDANKLLDYNSNEGEDKFRFEHTTYFNDYKLNFGCGIEDGNYTNSTFQKVYTSTGLTNIDYHTTLNLFKWNVFAQLSKKFMDKRLTSSLGVRSDANNYSSAMSNMVNQISPRFSASYALTKKLSLNFNIGRFYQSPSFTTLGFKNNAGVLINKQNDLKYISVNHLVAGIEYQPNSFSTFSIEGFYKVYNHYPFSVKDSVCLASKGNDFGPYGDEEVLSTGKGHAYGVEVLGRLNLYKGFNIILAYTLVWSQFENIYGKYVPSSWDVRHILNLTASKEFKKNWNVGIKWRFVGGSPYTPYDDVKSSYKQAWDVRGQGYLDYSMFNSLRLKSFHQLDIRIDKQYFFKKWSLMIYVDIQNAYNYLAQQPPTLIRVTDQNGNPVVINPTASDEQKQYELKYIKTRAGTILPTLGIILQF